LPDQSSARVEVTLGRKSFFEQKRSSWSPILHRSVLGTVNRVVLHGSTVFLDGTLSSSPMGRDISLAESIPKVSSPPPLTRGSFSGGTRPNVSALDGVLPVLQASKPSTTQPATSFSSGAEYSTLTVGPARPSFRVPPPHPAFHRRHILSVKQFTHQDIHDLFNLAHEMRLQVERNSTIDILRGRVLCTLFYEPSTRTSASFEAAMKRCGGEVVQVSATTSSVVKGESLADTIRTLGCYCDAIVLRHPEIGSQDIASKFSPVPILNAGDGIGEHPTQVCISLLVITPR
jgi:carbamoyl-phosphate synthase/aspartate carbamoyltransferase